MPGTLGRRRLIGGGRTGLQTGYFVLIAILTVAGMGLAASGPDEQRPLAVAERKNLLVERNRFSREATTLERQKKYVQAIAAAEKMLTIERQLYERDARRHRCIIGKDRAMPSPTRRFPLRSQGDRGKRAGRRQDLRRPRLRVNDAR